MKIEELNQGDRIAFDGHTREVKHVALHPSGTTVIFKRSGVNPFERNIQSKAYLENAGWELKGRRITERVG